MTARPKPRPRAVPGARLVLSSAPPGRARALARALVAERLAACASILPGAVSHYRWKGRAREERESLLLLKAPAARLPALLRRLAELHPYEVPEILALPVARGHAPYLAWLAAETAALRRR